MRKDDAKSSCSKGDKVEVIVKPHRVDDDGVRIHTNAYRVIGIVNSVKHCVSLKTGSKPLRLAFRDVLVVDVIEHKR